ncbi:hypothetical protein [Martelella endophytica]|uniref:PepSY domain-containing protein n=1 Tax=Martelella endophytica TaxID=1486262 RepID=A0A0D5LNN2_MAREN|nr:hypothetical protein [Martelella endophytica]AJY45362.1 hypothetical protein TM49_06090 [Martelella endophytica]
MNKIFASAALVTVLAAPAAFAVQPTAIPDTGKLTKAPVGSAVEIRAKDQFGNEYQNIFQVAEDGSLEFVHQLPESN